MLRKQLKKINQQLVRVLDKAGVILLSSANVQYVFKLKFTVKLVGK